MGSAALSDNPHNAGNLQQSSKPQLISPGAQGTAPQESTSAASKPRDKETEKLRLQEIVRDFSKAAISGILVSVIDAETQEISQTTLMTDKYLATVSLKTTGSDE